MRFDISRAMQVACLEEDQLERLHKLENRVNYCIPNWNIQTLFNIPSIKDEHEITNDPHLQEKHTMRIKKALMALDLIGEYDIAPSLELGLEPIHDMDKNILSNKAKVIWEYSPSAGGKLSGKLKDSN